MQLLIQACLCGCGGSCPLAAIHRLPLPAQSASVLKLSTNAASHLLRVHTGTPRGGFPALVTSDQAQALPFCTPPFTLSLLVLM